jgi:RimJ/RimL family protein N-acetyltransferase
MNISDSLFDGKLVRLTPIDHDKDAEVEARWTQDPAFMRMMYTEPMRPLSVFQVKKQYEKLEKKIDERNDLFHFRIRAKADERLLGFCDLHWIAWPTGSAHLQLGIGDPQDWRKGYGSEALRMLLHYAFAEINLYRLTALVPEYNEAALALFSKAGFREEVRRRQALKRDGRRWDALGLGLLVDEWKE